MTAPITFPKKQRGLIPPLESGDRLTRDEFERRYDAMPDNSKAELIEGVVFVSSPTRYEMHGRQHADFTTWLGNYRIFTPGVLAADNTTVRLDLDNEPQPDSLLFVEPQRGGQAIIDKDGYIAGAPELAGEISASSASIDLHQKFTVYHRNGVKEYIVWRVLDEAIDWFILRGGEFEQLAPAPDGFLKSEQFPGLWLDADAMIRGDVLRVFQVLQQGLASPEHADFVAKLRAAKS
jgi:Uma2 family endonuclease